MPTPTNSSENMQPPGQLVPEASKDTEEVDTDPDDGHNLTGNTSSDANTTGQHKDKRHRPRKKKLYAEICKQLEFYFSDANITKNRMMHEMVTSSEYVPLTTLLEFNKMQKMTTEIKDLQRALAKSEKLVLSEDENGVKRINAYDPSKLKDEATIEECTIYVENVPKHVDHQWLETIFQVFGPIAYISLPKFKHNGQPKGFAFVEYESPESSNRCLEAYGQQGAGFSGDVDPSELQSIQTYESQQQSQQVSDSSDTQTSSGNNEGSKPSSSKKRKLDEEKHESETEEKKVKLDTVEQTEEQIKAQENESVPASSKPLASDTGHKKKKRRKQNKTKKTNEEKLESDSIKLRVLPKKKWRQLRNRYLNLQRENMAKLKYELRQTKSAEGYNSYDPNDAYHQQKQNFNSYQRQNPYQRQNAYSYSKQNSYSCQKQNANPNNQLGTKPKSKIVKINLSTPSESVDVFKKQIVVDLAGQGQFDGSDSRNEVVKYVDYNEGKLEAFIRLDADPSVEECVNEFVQKAGRVFKSVELLTEKEGDEYWQLVRKTHKTKKENKSNKIIRGRDKLLLAASKSNHVHFGDEDEDNTIEDSK